MTAPRLVLCSGVTEPEDSPLREGRKVLSLDAIGDEANVNIKLENLTRVFLKRLNPRMVDLLEIASYVYATDCATNRGEGWTNKASEESWDRDFHFVIPVRDVEFWSRAEVVSTLRQLLLFLSNDQYTFEFRRLVADRTGQEYFDLGDDDDWPFYGVERVTMFSGGLDSLAGAVETANKGEKLVLVSHRPVGSINKRQRELFEEFNQTYPDNPMVHIPVWINKDEELGRESTQRTRSFLYAAIGAVVAESINAKGIRFFENGVVSLNLPVADEVLRARASRTTHPKSLHYLSRLLSLVVSPEFVVDNPFMFKTKTEVVALLAHYGVEKFILLTRSCTHTRKQSKNQWHCGTCSQCIDRRIAILAAGLESSDTETDYVSDVFTGKRQEGYERNMAVNFARHATELHMMPPDAMASVFNRELTSAVSTLLNRGEAFEQFIEMHQRHAEAVVNVLREQIRRHDEGVVLANLEKTSMLGLVAGREHHQSAWLQYSERITSLLRNGLPRACQTHKPKDEPHLQQIMDGILCGDEERLTREYPFMLWASSMTKPDLSNERRCLWVEAKYIREKRYVRQITEDISSDITKYGDNQRRTLFVVYDPCHYVTDEATFSEDIERHEGMIVRFVR